MKRQSKVALWATKMFPSSTRITSGATRSNVGASFTMSHVMLVRRVTKGGIDRWGLTRVSYTSTISPSLTTTAANSVIRSWSQDLPPVVSVSTTTYDNLCRSSAESTAPRERATTVSYGLVALSATIQRPSAARE